MERSISTLPEIRRRFQNVSAVATPHGVVDTRFDVMCLGNDVKVSSAHNVSKLVHALEMNGTHEEESSIGHEGSDPVYVQEDASEL